MWQLYITLLAIDRDMRGQGLGQTLMTEIKRIALQQGFTSVALEVNKTNIRAINYYFHQGFKMKEDRENKYLMCMLV